MTWEEVLHAEVSKSYFVSLASLVKQKANVCPPVKDMFRAFELLPFSNIKVVILGQDPYHGVDQADGLAFSVSKQPRQLPPSLRNIFAELKSDLGIENTSGDLSPWARQGVLLLNTILTVSQDHPASHANIGWEVFTSKVISEVSLRLTGVVFVLWGAHAQSKEELIDNSRHLVLKCPHPSPLSASRGFFGCKHFSLANQYLLSNGKVPVDWRI
jgi:uracil-DNA glycosylase